MRFRAIFLALCWCVGCATPTKFIVQAEPARARRPLPAGTGGMSGFADYHAHMFSEIGFGQRLFHGDAYPRGGATEDEQIADALADCTHARFPHLSGMIAIPKYENGHSSRGYPEFETWPSYDTMFHQQMYIDWVYRAYRTGLRLIVITVTNSETICEAAGRRGAPCNDMQVVDAQLAAIETMLSSIAAREGAWMQLARSPKEARTLIGQNRLAVVIGIEVDTLLDCAKEGDAGCDPMVFGPWLDRLYNRGVRQINPVHLIDNGFGGAAIYDERFNINQLVLRGTTMVPLPRCVDSTVDYELQGAKGVKLLEKLIPFFETGRRYDPEYDENPRGEEGHCNEKGLTREGQQLLRALMGRGMLIDTDHMSEASITRASRIAREACASGDCYPLMAAHTWFRDLKGRLPGGSDVYHGEAVDLVEALDLTTEMHKSARVLGMIKELGGVVGVLTNQGWLRGHGGTVANDCDTSSKSLAQAILYAVDLLDGSGGVGFGTDFNGLPGQPGPRFGDEACGAKKGDASFATQARQVERLSYPFTDYYGGHVGASQAGNRVFDFNEMGLAHYGLLPDLIADMQLVGLPQADVRVLFRSAEAYVRMWEQAERAKAAY